MACWVAKLWSVPCTIATADRPTLCNARLSVSMLAKAVILGTINAMTGGAGGFLGGFTSVFKFNKGGMIDFNNQIKSLPKFDKGGFVKAEKGLITKGVGTIDKIPALLRPGEVVMGTDYVGKLTNKILEKQQSFMMFIL